ncbi:MAG: hypothetical protein NTZ26_03210 [Candidatus Aminicenantes bacterium]|nr:hypothetical protein [Candidatus Aminicenantes bacterium]
MPPYSPALAILTGLFELLAAAWTLNSPGRKSLLRPTAFIFILLAGYQFAEVAVCSRPENLLFSRIAFLDITWLPPVGIWLVYRLLAPKPRRILFPAAFIAAAVAMSAWIALDPAAITKSVCQTVVARYFHGANFDFAFGMFYQAGMGVLIFWPALTMAGVGDANARSNLATIQTGVLGFVLPSLFLRLFVKEPDGIMPSVMCHFAVTLAVALTLLVSRERRLAVGEEKRIQASHA